MNALVCEKNTRLEKAKTNKQTNKQNRSTRGFLFFLGDRLRGEGLATDSVFSALTELLLNTKEMKRSKTNSH